MFCIEEELKKLPHSPGVYIMHDKADTIIYVGKAIDLNKVKRGDLIALRSAGAYGEIMASGYNCRELPKGYTSDELV